MPNKKTTILIIILIILVAGFFSVWKIQTTKKQKLLDEQKKEEEIKKAEENEKEKEKQEEAEEISWEEVDTSDWKVYKNEDLGFEFKYPKGWVIEKPTVDNFGAVVYLNSPRNEEHKEDLKNDNRTFGEDYMYDITVSFYKNIEKEPENEMNNLNAKTIRELIDKNSVITDAKKIRFMDNKVAWEMTWGGFSSYYVILIENDKGNIYKILFGNIDKREKLSTEEKGFLENFKIKGKLFNSSLINLNFIYPSESEYQELDVYEKNKIAHIGKAVSFTDQNDVSPDFDIITKDFLLKEGINFTDIVKINLNSENPVHLIMNEYEEKVIKKGEYLYQIIGFQNYECSPGVGSQLVYLFPKESEFKYALFYLGGYDFLEKDMIEVCTPSKEIIQKKIDLIFNNKDVEIVEMLNKAIEISKSFSSN